MKQQFSKLTRKSEAKIKWVIPIVLFSFLPLQAQQKWTLKDCVDYAKQHHTKAGKTLKTDSS